MNEVISHLNWARVRRRIKDTWKNRNRFVYGVPRGGSVIAAMMPEFSCWPVDEPGKADFIVDDLIDSGRTMQKFRDKWPEKGFYAPFDKRDERDKDLGWIIFPWEATNPEGDAEDTVARLLQQIGEDPRREGLLETPKRVVRSWKELFGGYALKPEDVLKTQFQKDGYDQMVILRDIEFHSFCEHHMLPFSGTAAVAYIPEQKVVGLSKLARLVDLYAKRLQIQERLTQQVANTLQNVIRPKGTGVIMQAKHHCMLCRGVGKQHSSMITSALTGVFKEPAVRQEFLQLARG
jgi:GTP cyclohydrolase I